jgi:pimeloyl-ACP methyl ester carboxylesterase
MVFAQQLPSALTTDPPKNRQSPAAMVALSIPSHGVEMNAVLYLAAGAGPHPSVLLLHGLPGYEQNIDLAQSIRRAGWNVLIFHYRGSWGTPGTFSLESAIEDTAAATRFLMDPAITKKYRIDPKRLVAIGHSMGGFLAGYEAAHNARHLSGVAMVSAVNLGTIANAAPEEVQSRLERWQGQMRPLSGCTAEELFAEAKRHTKDWNYVGWAPALKNVPVLIVMADDQNHSENEALASEMKKVGAPSLQQVSVSTDHSFSDSRIALQAVVLRWLDQLK